MYLPFLRGKQNELIALRELIDDGIITENILPIIEPVKYSSTLVSTIETFVENRRRLVMIINPKVGNFLNDLDEQPEIFKRIKEILQSPYVIIGYHMNKTSLMELPELAHIFNVNLEDIAIIHDDITHLAIYDELYSTDLPFLNIVPSESSFKRRFVNQNAVVINKSFKKQTRNVDYSNLEDEFFSDEHRYYESDGFVGFSDYSIVGDEFIEGGFGALAVAIHIIYPDTEYNLRVRHFVSDSNEDRTDPAGKFYEATSKLVAWANDINTSSIRTKALTTLIRHNEAGTFPGLGIAKKLCIMHHLEIVEDLLVSSKA